MPKVRMPDGILVDMPDNPSPELKARLQAVLQKQQGAVPEPAQVPGRTFIDPGTVETPKAESITLGDTLKGAITNIPSSGLEYGKNIANAVIHPIETAKTLGKVTQGGLAKGAQTLGMIPTTEENIPLFDSVIDMFKERYGGVENLKKTLSEDPVGFAADFSALMAGGGALAARTGLKRTANIASKVSAATDPLIVAKGAVAGARKLIPKKVPERLYESAAKFSTTLTHDQRIALVNTALNEGVLPTEKGLRKANAIIEGLDKQITDTILGAAKSGKTVSTNRIIQRLDELKPFYRNTINPKEYLDDIEALAEKFKTAHGQRIPVDKAQAIKQNTYRLLKDKYGEMKGHLVESQKTIARGIKEELAKKYPELTALNAREGALLELEKSLERAVARIENLNMVGIGTPISGAAVAAVTGSAKAGWMAMVGKSLLDHPKIKSRIAVALHRARMKGLSLQKSNIQKGGAIAFQSGRIQEQKQEEENGGLPNNASNAP